MTNPQQLPHLLKLLDDDSPFVQKKVSEKLATFGDGLEDALGQLAIPLSFENRMTLQFIMQDYQRQWLSMHWPELSRISNEYERLEMAFSFIASFNSRYIYPVTLKEALDNIAQEYYLCEKEVTPYRLLAFLFYKKRFYGEKKDYYSPNNADLLYVLHEGRGLPISLSAIFMLVGYRLGLLIEGCALPGHFLAKFKDGRKVMLVDCFNKGAIVNYRDLRKIYGEDFSVLQKIISQKTEAHLIIQRLLANLIQAYQRREDWSNAYFFVDLLQFTQSSLFTQGNRAFAGREGIQGPKFRPGEIVCHKEYGYSGLIVDLDLRCRQDKEEISFQEAEESRNQPWYHILVDRTDRVAYAAESHLSRELAKKRVQHPLIPYFFHFSRSGEYVRNEHLWPRF